MVQVRIGVPADHGAALAVWAASTSAGASNVPASTAQAELAKAYLRQPDAFLVVAEDSEEIVGMTVGMQALEDDGKGPPMPGLAHFAMVFVGPGRWGEGIGRCLVKRLVREAHERGYRGAQLWTAPDNLRAQKLYEGLGFRQSGRAATNEFGAPIVHYQLRDLRS